MKFIFALLITTLSGFAATYTVSPSGSDSNTGSALSPWLTLSHAATNVSSGDTVNVKAGTYNEVLVHSVSGVQWHGNVDGLWSAVIDPSFPMTNWVLATEPICSNGVYKTTGLSYPIREMTVGAARQRMNFVSTPGDITSLGFASVYTNKTADGSSMLISNGLQFLSMPSDQVLGNAYGTFNAWDDLGAVFASTGSVCYVRFKNGEDPNTMDLRGNDANEDIISGAAVTKAAVWMIGVSNITFNGFLVRGAASGIQLKNDTRDCVISSNYISGCHVQIYSYGAGQAHGLKPRNNSFIGNVLNGNLYAWTNTGAWTTQLGTYYSQFWAQRKNNYEFCKYMIGSGSEYGDGLFFYHAGDSNVCAYNTISNSWGNGFQFRGQFAHPMTNMLCFSNYVSHFPSTAICHYGGYYGLHIFRNRLEDANGVMRPCEPWSTGDGAETNRMAYIYQNTIWNPTNHGDAYYLFWIQDGGMTNWSDIWFYNNSLSGGDRMFALSGYFVDNLGAKGYRIFNNIFSGHTHIATYDSYWVNGPSGYISDASYFSAFDYNAVTTTNHPSASYAWFGNHNVFLGQNKDQWDNQSSTFSFALTNGSIAIDAALDVTVPFTLNGTNYAALPMTGTKVGNAWDIGALEYGIPKSLHSTTINIGTMNVWQTSP